MRMLIFNNAIQLDLAWFIMKNINSSADVALYWEFFYLCCKFFPEIYVLLYVMCLFLWLACQ